MIDIIISWPDAWDYPLCRKLLHDIRILINDVFIVYTPTNLGRSLIAELSPKFARDNITTVMSNTALSKDWRDASIKTALLESKAQTVWFLEQDFLIQDPMHFVAKVADALDNSWKVVGFWEDNTEVKQEYLGRFAYDEAIRKRFHPACLLIDRVLLEQTSKDFGAHPDQNFDHFGKVSFELYDLIPFERCGFRHLASAGLVKGRDWRHLTGLTNNMYRELVGEEIVNPEQYYKYKEEVEECLRTNPTL